jgi:hypothetical protein
MVVSRLGGDGLVGTAWWWWAGLMVVGRLDGVIHTNMISIKITTFLALVWVQTQRLTHTNPFFLGWVELLKTHRITQPGLGYGGLGWVQPTPFRRVAGIEGCSDCGAARI